MGVHLVKFRKSAQLFIMNFSQVLVSTIRFFVKK